MDLSKTLIERILLDTASLIVVVTAILYSFGMAFSLGMLDGFGLTDDILSVGFRETIFLGFFSLFVTPFLSPIMWGVSLIGLLPVLLISLKVKVPNFVLYAGGAFFLFMYIVACGDTGEVFSKDELKNLESSLNGNIPPDFEPISVKVQYNNSNNKLEMAKGYGLDIPGDFFVVAMKNEIRAINKSNVISISYGFNKKH